MNKFPESPANASVAVGTNTFTNFSPVVLVSCSNCTEPVSVWPATVILMFVPRPGSAAARRAVERKAERADRVRRAIHHTVKPGTVTLMVAVNVADKVFAPTRH